MSSAPTSAPTIARVRRRYFRRSLTSPERVAALRFRGWLRKRLFLLGGGVIGQVRSHRAPVELDLDARCDAHAEHVFAELGDHRVQSARGNYLVSDAEVVEHQLNHVLPALLRTDEHEPEEEEREDDEKEAEAAHKCPSWVSRESASRRQLSNAPRSIARRASRTRSMRKRRLCRLRRRMPRISCWFTRCRMYARLKRLHAGQPQCSSSGPGSRWKRAFRRLSLPSQVSALPVRAVRVGSTQSNMSTPLEITSMTPPGSPIPMK